MQPGSLILHHGTHFWPIYRKVYWPSHDSCKSKIMNFMHIICSTFKESSPFWTQFNKTVKKIQFLSFREESPFELEFSITESTKTGNVRYVSKGNQICHWETSSRWVPRGLCVFYLTVRKPEREKQKNRSFTV